MSVSSIASISSNNRESFEHLLSNYKISFKNSFKPNTHVLTEAHGNKHCQKLNGDVISYLARRSPHPLILLIEGAPSMKKIEDAEGYLKSRYYIHKDIHHKIELYGWDADENTLDIIGSSNGVRSQAFKTLNNFDSRLKSAYKRQRQITQLQQNYINYVDEFKFSLSLEILKKIKLLIDNLNLEFNAIEQGNGILEEAKKKVQKEFEKPVATDEVVSLTFPSRTVCQKKTLRIIREWREQNVIKGDVVLVCGFLHARTSEEYKSREEYNLDLFYEELRNHDAIVMTPKIIDHD